MTRHSTLTNPNDLHYAKVRTFSGDPNLVTPDFVDQLLIASDSKKVYTSTSTNQGAIVQLVASIGENLAASIELGQSRPSTRPNATGRLYLDISSNSFYASVLNPLGIYWWRRIIDVRKFISCVVSDQSNTSVAAKRIKVFFAPNIPSEIEQGFDFTVAIADIDPNSYDYDQSEFYKLIYEYGPGVYTFGYEIIIPEAFEGMATGIDIPSGGAGFGDSGVYANPNPLTANGLPISSNYLYIEDLPPNSFSERVTFNCYFTVV